jgi:hypothetical protein
VVLHYDMDETPEKQTAAASIAGIVKSMIEATEGFDVRESEHRKAVVEAIGEVSQAFGGKQSKRKHPYAE